MGIKGIYAWGETAWSGNELLSEMRSAMGTAGVADGTSGQLIPRRAATSSWHGNKWGEKGKNLRRGFG